VYEKSNNRAGGGGPKKKKNSVWMQGSAAGMGRTPWGRVGPWLVCLKNNATPGHYFTLLLGHVTGKSRDLSEGFLVRDVFFRMLMDVKSEYRKKKALQPRKTAPFYAGCYQRLRPAMRVDSISKRKSGLVLGGRKTGILRGHQTSIGGRRNLEKARQTTREAFGGWLKARPWAPALPLEKITSR